MSLQKNTNLFLPVSKIHYAIIHIPDSDVESIIEHTDGTVTVNFFSGSEWKEIYMTKETGRFSQKHSYEDEGNLYKQELSINYPGSSSDNQNILKNLIGKPLLIKIDVAGCEIPQSLIFGSLENPVFISDDFSIADNVAVRVLSFLHQNYKPASYLRL